MQSNWTRTRFGASDFTSFREIQHQNRGAPREGIARWVEVPHGVVDALKIYFVQVKYTNRNSSNAIRTMSVAEPAADIAMYAF